MARDTFVAVPVNRNARARLLRAARLGARPVAAGVDYGDAARAVDAVRAYREGWTSSRQDVSRVVRLAWAIR